MQVGIITLFPNMFEALHSGMTGQALKRDLLNLHYWNPRDFATDRHRTVDDRPYGGGPGMVLQYAPLQAAIQAAKQCLGDETRVVYLSPQGQPLTQALIQALAQRPRHIFIAGRYEGIDERLHSEINEEYSLGDYILSGGELAIMVLIDAMTRLLPGVLGDAESAVQESFVQGILDHPHYTRPEQMADQAVPEVLMQGNHAAIARWRLKQALGRTWLRRPELIEKISLTELQQQLLIEFINEMSDFST